MKKLKFLVAGLVLAGLYGCGGPSYNYGYYYDGEYYKSYINEPVSWGGGHYRHHRHHRHHHRHHHHHHHHHHAQGG